MSKESPSIRAPYNLIIVFVLMAAGIISVGYFYLKRFYINYRIEIEQQLTTIANLKTSELRYWRDERIADAAMIHQNFYFSELLQSYLDNPLKKNEVKERINALLKQYLGHYEYDAILLFDSQGNLIMSYPSSGYPVSSFVSKGITNTVQSKEITIVDLYQDEYDKHIYLSVLIPIINAAAGNSIIGAVSLQINPEKFLYPYILSWPMPSETAETLLVRREGDNALFLNNIRFNKDAALKVRIPLTKTEIAAVKAVLGYTGLMEALDYKGVPVIADIRPIPGSPWFLITRIDEAEVLARGRDQSLIVIGLITAILFSAGLSMTFFWRQQSWKYYLKEHELSEKLKRSNEELQQFAYIASHDLQEPLRMIASYLQLIKRRYKGKLDKDADEFISFAVDGAHRLQEMIIGLLHYSRLETKGIQFQEVNTSEVLATVLINLKVLIDENGAVITTDPLPIVKADNSQLIQVFQNLISNAIKFKGEGSPLIHISAKPVLDYGDRIVSLDFKKRANQPVSPGGEPPNAWLFAVKDNGIGIANEYNDRIFNIFQRLHGREYSGVGLGLSACKKIIEKHGGRIWFESEPGEGTVFYFTIPIKKEGITSPSILSILSPRISHE